MLQKRTRTQKLQKVGFPLRAGLIWIVLLARLFSRQFSSRLCLIRFERFGEMFKTPLKLTTNNMY